MNIPPPATEEVAQCSSVSSSQVLIVDDHEDSAEMLRMMLKGLGCEATVAANGIEALRIANESRPRLILLDIRMPKLDGYDTCGVIRAQPWGNEVKIIAVTGEDKGIKESSESKGFDGYLIKPIELADLERLIKAGS